MSRATLLSKIQSHYIPERVSKVDHDFLSFEEDMTTEQDLEKIIQCGRDNKQLLNPHNSLLLYCTGLSDEFNFSKERCDMKGGSPPDIDVDWEALGRDKAVELVINQWGRENVANIITHGTLKPKSLTRKFFKLSTPSDFTKLASHESLMREILGKIPPPLFGKEPTLKDIINGNKDKGWKAAPELATEAKYKDWYTFASKLEDMICNFGIHAAGVVISDFPIYQQIPCWSNGKSELITQYDMDTVDKLGLIKFDFLSINNLDILKECTRLIKISTGKEFNIYDIADGDKKAYDLLHSGMLCGIFQLETSKTVKELTTSIKPLCIEDISDISAICRPGPLAYSKSYIDNKNSGLAPEGLPKVIADLIAHTHYILLYQEDVMNLCKEIAGFTLREADDIRKALGKKDLPKLVPYREAFIAGMIRSNISKEYAEEYWDKTMVPFASYSFNKSHSVAYSVITYVCAYFKANYPVEFFCALMTIRSAVMQPKLWAEKAPEYIQEAKQLGVHIHSPSVQTSRTDFTIVGTDIYFGFSGIKGLGATVCKALIKARGDTKFKDIWDFMARIDQRVINTKVLESLIISGAFDTMGYQRADLLEKVPDLASYLPAIQDYAAHVEARRVRAIEISEVVGLREELDVIVDEAKAQAKAIKKLKQPVPPEIEQIANIKDTFSVIAQCYSQEGSSEPEELGISEKAIALYKQYGRLRKMPALREQEEPIRPELTRSKQVSISVEELMRQSDYIGCYLGTHPAKVIFPYVSSIASLTEGAYEEFAGQVVSIRISKTKKGTTMGFLQVNDGTATAEVTIFDRQYTKLIANSAWPQEGDIVKIAGKIEQDEPVIKIIADNLTLHRRNK